ncbi:MAG: hypothetical protein ACN6QE_03850 [Pseudomonas putida]
MIEFESWPVVLKLSFLLAPFVIGLSGVAIIVRIAITKELKVAISSITTSPYLEQMKIVWGGGSLRSRCLLVSTISGLVIFPGPHVRRGLLSPDEVRNFPSCLKRKMKIAFWLLQVGFFWMLIGCLLI